MSARKSANQQDITMEKLLKSQNSLWLKHRRNLCFLFLWMAAQICFEASLTEMVLRGCLRVLGVIMEYDLFRWWLNMGLLISYAYHTWLCKGQTLEGPPKGWADECCVSTGLTLKMGWGRAELGDTRVEFPFCLSLTKSYHNPVP